MRVTVAVCTWNRARLLDATLAAMRKLAVPERVEWEVLVVDNASSDETPSVCRRHQGALPLRCAFEPRQGLSHARNRAVAEARGDLIAWTDDDVLVEDQWLTAYARAEREHPDVSFFGGPVRAWFETEPPPWLPAGLPVIETAYAIRDFGGAPFPFEKGGRLPFGANFAVRAAVQRRHAYDPDLGRLGSVLRAGEESALLEGLLDRGYRGLWVPDARVRHFVGRERMTLAWVRDFYRGIGHSDVVATAATALPRWVRWWRRADCALRGSVKGGRYRLRRRLAPTQSWIRDLRDASIHWGRFEAYGARETARRAG